MNSEIGRYDFGPLSGDYLFVMGGHAVPLKRLLESNVKSSLGSYLDETGVVCFESDVKSGDDFMPLALLPVTYLEELLVSDKVEDEEIIGGLLYLMGCEVATLETVIRGYLELLKHDAGVLGRLNSVRVCLEKMEVWEAGLRVVEESVLDKVCGLEEEGIIQRGRVGRVNRLLFGYDKLWGHFENCVELFETNRDFLGGTVEVDKKK